jgi:hypothetical protein
MHALNATIGADMNLSHQFDLDAEPAATPGPAADRNPEQGATCEKIENKPESSPKQLNFQTNPGFPPDTPRKK